LVGTLKSTREPMLCAMQDNTQVVEIGSILDRRADTDAVSFGRTHAGGVLRRSTLTWNVTHLQVSKAMHYIQDTVECTILTSQIVSRIMDRYF